MVGCAPVTGAAAVTLALFLGSYAVRGSPLAEESRFILLGVFDLAIASLFAIPRAIRSGSAPRFGLGGRLPGVWVGLCGLLGWGASYLGTARAGLFPRAGDFAACLLLLPIAIGEAVVFFALLFETLNGGRATTFGGLGALVVSVASLALYECAWGAASYAEVPVATLAWACAASGILYIVCRNVWAVATFLDLFPAMRFSSGMAWEPALGWTALGVGLASVGSVGIAVWVSLKGELGRARGGS